VLSPVSKVVIYSADLSDEGQAIAAVESLAATLGGIDILINSAGVLYEGRFENIPQEAFVHVMNVNLFGVINTTRAALARLKHSRGQLVNIASMASLTGVFGYTAYAASKHALAGFSESLRYELKPQGVTVQLICPPEFESPMTQDLGSTRTPENEAHTTMVPKEPIGVVVRDAVKAIESGNYMTVTGLRAKIAAFGVRYFPGILRAVADRAIAKARPH
jgi:3-dehydrosphinganine reductase